MRKRCSDYHNVQVDEKTGAIIADPNCPRCQANVKFIKTITGPNCTTEEYNQALKEYRQ